MKNILKLIGIIALVAVIGFSFIGCDNGTDDDDSGDNGTTGGGSGGGYNGPLVGKWYDTQEDADKVAAAEAAGKLYTVSQYTSLAQSGNLPNGAWYDYPLYTFKSNGTLIIAGGSIETTYTATANTVTMSNYQPATYTISGTVLTISSPDMMTGFGKGELKLYKPRK